MHRKVTNKNNIFNIEGALLSLEPLWRHTTFGVGGAADLFAVPNGDADLENLVKSAGEVSIPIFVLGGGSNLLVSDQGIRGLVIDTRLLNKYSLEDSEAVDSDNTLILGAGLDISDAAWRSGSSGLKGLEYFFGMPGSVGGAVWMNARCYNGEISDSFLWAEVMDRTGRIQRISKEDGGWAYKASPFQESDSIILRAAFGMKNGESDQLKKFMLEKRDDRETKGHFRSPCAGSAFKNNRAFGSPSGVLIDKCGLKGLRIGGAAVSDWHGNIVINDQGASAKDIRDLLDKVADKVEEDTGFHMEAEVCCVGDWKD